MKLNIELDVSFGERKKSRLDPASPFILQLNNCKLILAEVSGLLHVAAIISNNSTKLDPCGH